MALAAAGLVAVVVFSTTDVLSDREVAGTELHNEQWFASATLTGEGTRIGRDPEPASKQASTTVASDR